MSGFENRYWSSDDLKLHYRDYPGDPAATPVICIPGLTRNARDFHDLACRFAGTRRMLAVNLRGRGGSDYARDPMTYVPAAYVRDMEALLADQAIGRFVAVGTSLGGIVTMLLAAAGAPIAGAVLNDVGPEIEPAGLRRIRSYVGRGSTFPTWMHAARAVQEVNGSVYPHWGIADWLAMAKRIYRLTSSGRIVLDYDLRIAEPFKVAGQEAGPDMWAALGALREVPVLVVRGDRSDVLARHTAERMAAALPRGELLTVPGVGHAPTLGEAGVADAVGRVIAAAG
jgi:pimeloyl-ACP methyl ester carboxylesterase